MSVTSVRKLSDIAEAIGKGKDARTVLVDAIGKDNIENFEPFHNLVLVATYVRSDITKGGIIIGGDRTRAEDRFQGKIGLVLKVGPTAFKDDKTVTFGGVIVKPGDWVMYRTSDAEEFGFVDEKSPLDFTSARLIQDTLIKGRVTDPERIF